MKPGDIFQWKYKKQEDHEAPYVYHCKSRFCIANEIGLMDTYWGLNSKDGRHWTFEKAYELLELKFLANIKDLEPLEAYNREFYTPEAVVDLRHSNGGQLYLQKNTGRNLAATVAYVTKIKEAWERDHDWAQHQVEHYQKMLGMLNEPGVDIEKVYASPPYVGGQRCQL